MPHLVVKGAARAIAFYPDLSLPQLSYERTDHVASPNATHVVFNKRG